MKVQKSVQLEIQLTEIVHKCVQLRKKYKYTIIELAKTLELDRRVISDFEKGKFNIFLADNILSYFGHDLILWANKKTI